MVLFCGEIRRDSVSLIRFLFLFLSCEISVKMFVELGFFSFFFLLMLVLSVLFLVTVINQCALLVFVSMHRRCLECWRVLFLLLFLTHIIYLRHVWNVRPYVSPLLFLFSGPFVEILFSSTSPNDPEYLTKETAQVFIPLMRFLQFNLFSSCFLVLLR